MIINDYINVSDERLLDNVIPSQTQEVSFKSVDEMLKYFSTVSL